MADRFDHLHRRALEEFRGYQEPERSREPRRVGELMDAVLAHMGLGDKLKEEEVKAAWKEIVGDFLAQHSEPVALVRGVLQVQVLQSTVHYELDRVWKSRILDGFQARFGSKVVRDIKFRA